MSKVNCCNLNVEILKQFNQQIEKVHPHTNLIPNNNNNNNANTFTKNGFLKFIRK